MEAADDYNTSALQKCSDKHDRSCMVEGDRRIRSYLDAGGDNKNENGNPSGKHISQYIDRGYGNGHGGGDDNALHCDDFSYGDQPTEYYAEILPAEWSRMK